MTMLSLAASVSLLSDRTFHRAQPIAALGLALGNDRDTLWTLRVAITISAEAGDGRTDGRRW